MTTIEHIVSPEELMAHLDGELAPERAVSVRAHLSDCAACQTLAAQLRGLTDDLRTWTVEAPPETLRAPARPPAPRARGLFARWPPALRHAAAAAGVIVALGSVLWVAQFPSARHSLDDSIDAPDTLQQTAPRGVSVSVGGSVAGGGGGTAVRGVRSRPAATEMAAAAPVAGNVAQEARVNQPGQLIVRAVTLTVVTRDFAAVRPAVEGVLRGVAGFVGSIQVSGDPNAGSLYATLRVPANRLDEAVAALRGLGRVVDERQSGDDVTEQVRDLEARLTNSRNTERRLTEVLRTRTGRVSDVLEVEREIARVREDIERMDAQRTSLERRVAYATITLQVSQERQATLDLGPQPVSAKLRNALVDGLRGAFGSAIAVALWMLTVAPTLLLWVVVLWWPVRFAVRRGRRAWAADAS